MNADRDRALAVPTRLTPTRDDHLWYFPTSTGHRTRVRMRAWPTDDGGHLVIATDFMLGGGLINKADSFYAAVVREFGDPVTVVRHFPAHTMMASSRDQFEQVTLDDRSVAHGRTCTSQIVDMLGPRILGFPGDSLPGPVDLAVPAVAPQSVQMARLLAAALRLGQVHGTFIDRDLDQADALVCGHTVLAHFADFLANVDIDDDSTTADHGRKLERIVTTLKEQAWELLYLHDEITPGPHQ